STNDSLKSVAYISLTYAYKTEPTKILDIAAEMAAYAETITSKKMKALWLRKIGAVYHKQNLYDKALEYGLQSASIYEELNDKAGLASCFNNIGNAYAGKGTLTGDKILLDRSIEYHLKCMQIRKETGDTLLLRNSYNNIAIGYMEKKEIKKALEYLNIAYKEYSKSPRDENGLEMVTLNMADAYLELGKSEKNPDYFRKSLSLYESQLKKFGDERNPRYTEALIRMGSIYIAMGDKAKALELLSKGMEAAKRTDDKEAMLDASDPLAELSEQSGDFKKASEYLHLFIALKDSMINESNSKNIEQMQALYQSGKKDREIERLNTDKAIQNEKLNRQRIAIFSTIGGLVLILVLGFVLLSRYNLKKKANRQLSDAYAKIELKNRQITDSINYARRIQNSILPPDQELKRHLSSFFVFYAPKDIVSGDFYWFSKTGGYLFFVVADCTGHGVPGALMSMIGNTLLNEIINQKKIFDPGEILFHLNKGVTTALHQQEKLLTQDDGMDISICCISENDHTQLKYATANHSLFVKQKSGIRELTGDIFSIGGSIGGQITENHRQFETRGLTLDKGDFVVMSTDGYYDQFGGTHDSKFLVTKFEALILATDLERDAASAFKQAFESWKGPQKQTDDILVAGFKI
ncbi:MAG: SpoIIE family protein phosphatase, partial [Bacteroidia bacterium]